MKNNIVNRTAAYNALIAEVYANYCDKFDHSFYADDATFTLTIVSHNRNLEIVTCFEGGYLFDKYYDTVEEVLDAVSDFAVCATDRELTIDDVVSFIDSLEEEDEDLI